MTIEQIVGFAVDMLGVLGLCVAISAWMMAHDAEHMAKHSMKRWADQDKWDPIESRPKNAGAQIEAPRT